MNAVFADPLKVEQLGRVLVAWQGTPFYPRTAIRGVGVDCVQFAFAVLQDLDVVGPIDWPRYSVKGGGPDLVAMIHSRILLETCLREVDRIPLMPGDVLLFSDPVHLAICGPDGAVWQSLHPLGVDRGFIGEKHMGQLTHIYRAEVLS